MARRFGRRLALSAAGLAFLISACSFSQPGAVTNPQPVSPQYIVEESEKLAGPARETQASAVPMLAYTPPVSQDAKPEMVGNNEVYRNAQPDTSLVVRPVSGGHQALLYISNQQAPDQFNFTFTLPPEIRFEKQPDGSVSVVDQTTNLRLPMLKPAQAKSTDGNTRYPASLVVNNNSVALTVDLSGAKFPVVAVLDWVDPLKRLAEARLPSLEESPDAEAGGAKRDIPDDYGQVYISKDGLEIRLNNLGTTTAIDGALNANSASTNFSPLITAALNDAKTEITEALKTAGVATNDQANGVPDNVSLDNRCLAITVPKGSFEAYVNRYAAIWAEQYSGAGDLPKPDGLKVQLESCGQADETPEPPEPTTSQTEARTEPGSTVAPEARYVDMAQACIMAYGQGARARNTDRNNPSSWVCVNSENQVLGGVDLGAYCSSILSGSGPILVKPDAEGWRCLRIYA